MNIVVVNDNNELIAYISNTNIGIVMSGYDVVDYGNNEPVFSTDSSGKIYVDENKFIVDLRED